MKCERVSPITERSLFLSVFIITGKGGLPPSTEDPLINSYRIVEWETLSEKPESNAETPQNSRQSEEGAEEAEPGKGHLMARYF
jgi:hypothetical protein